MNHAAAPQADETDPALVRALQDIIALVDKRLLQPPSDVREIDFMVALRWVRDRVKPFAAMQQEGSKG